MTRALLFPGQGSKTIDISSFCEIYPRCKKIVESVSSFKPSYQLDLILSERVILEALRSEGIKYKYAAGLSLGAFSALSSLGCILDENIFSLIDKRAEFMDKFGNSDGCMLAVIDYPLDKLSNLCNKISEKNQNVLSIANINSPNQIVISGNSNSVQQAKNFLDKNNIFNMYLDVSGAYHTELMNNANQHFMQELNKIIIFATDGYVSNVTGTIPETVIELRNNIYKHMVSPVLWEKSMRTLIDNGVDEFIEVGPGHTLASFLKRIKPDVKVYCVSTPEDIRMLL